MRIQSVFSLPSRLRAPGRAPFAVLVCSAGLFVSHFANTGFSSRMWAAPGPETAAASVPVAPSPPQTARPEEARKTPAAPQLDAAHRARVAEAFGRLPLSFEPNQGQTDPAVKFLSRGRGYRVFLTQDETVLALRKQSAVGSQQSAGRSPSAEARTPEVLRMRLVGANATATLSGVEELPGKSNYFLGKDPNRWHSNIPNYRKVAVQNVYPGIDLVYHGEQRQLEYDFVVAPGADPATIRLAIGTGNSGLEIGNSKLENRQSAPNSESRTPNPGSLRIDANGDLVVQLDGGEVRLHKPVVYQEQLAVDSQQSTVENNRQSVDARYVLRPVNPKSKTENPKFEVAFALGPYDRTRPLIIDPVLSYSTYLGGSDIDVANSIAVGADGTAFIAGETDSVDFPVEHALQPQTGGPFDFPDDTFVAKLSADGSTLIYSTYLGGSRQDRANGIALDSFGAAYVTGTTISQDFPASIGAADPNCGNDAHCDADLNGGAVKSDAFATKLNPEGSAIVYSTFISHIGPLFVDQNNNPILDGHGNRQYLGANDLGFAIAVDLNGVAYVTGTTDYSDPAGPFSGQGNDAFLAKVSATGSAFLFFTGGNDAADFGGALEDQAFGVAADNAGLAYVTGVTYSNPFLGNASAGDADAFVMKINTTQPVATSLVYSRLLGGAGRDQGNGIAVDGAGSVYVTGVTNSTTFPTTAGVPKPVCTPEGDAFVSKFSSVPALVYSTCVGGSGADSGAGIALDAATNAYVTGFTNSADFPTVGVPFQDAYGGGNTDAFVFKLDPIGTTLLYSSYLGGSNSEEGKGIAVDVNGNAYIGGQTCSPDFPTARPLQATQAGNCDAFVAKVRVGPDIDVKPTTLGFGAQAVGTTSLSQTITITSIGDSPLDIGSITISGDFSKTESCSNTSLLNKGDTCLITVAFSPASIGPKTGQVSIPNNVTANPLLVSLTGSGTTLSISPTSLIFGDQGVGTTSAAQPVTMTNTGAGAVTIIGIDPSGDFTQNNTCGNSLAAGASCVISVTFAPTAIGIRTGTITITDNDLTSPQVITLTGHGTAAIAAVSPATLSFGDQGGTGPAQTVTLSNNGNAPLAISSISVTGAFSQTNTCGSTLVAGASCLISVNFVPSVPGAATGLLTITDSASGSPRTVALSGNGVVPAVSLAPTSLTFASQPVPTTSDAQTVVLTNTGNATLNLVTPAVVTGVNSADFAATDNCFPSVLAGATCAIRVTFTPSAAGTRLAAVTITDDAGNSPQTIALSGTGVIAPAVTLAPTSLSFPDTKVAVTSAPLTVTLTNSGSATLLISTIATTGDFTKSDACGSSIAVGGNCVISVTFTPAAVGNRYGTLTISDNATGSPHVVQLAGNGLPAPLVSLAPTSLTFATRPVNTPSAAQSVVLTNSGTATLNITSIAPTGTNSGDFAVASSSCGLTLAASASCTVNVTFTPTAAGTRVGSLTVIDDAAGSPHNVALSGSGVLAPAVTLVPTSLTFAGQRQGTTSAAQTVTLTNSGSAALNVTNIVASGDFAQTNTCGSTVAAGANCTISVTFTPTATGNRYGSVTITDNASDSPQTIPLAGSGLAAPIVNLAPTSLTFASQPVNSTSSGQTVVLANTGSATLNIASITITGVNNGDFARTTTCGATVPAGGNCAISVTFSPTAAGTRLAAVTIADDAGNSPQSIALSGTGVIAPAVTLSTGNLTFADQRVGTTSPSQPVTLTNSGSADLEISSIVMTGDFAKSDHCPTTMPASTSCTIDITFTPTAVGNRYGAMTINDNAGNSPQTVLLSGNGLPAPAVTLTPASLTFATQPVNTTSDAQNVVLANTGSATLNIASITITGVNNGDFARTTTCGATVLAGANCAISVTFSPTAAGTRLAAVTITDDAGNSPQSVALSGTGVIAPAVTLSPTVLAFGDQGVSGPAQTVTLRNTGSAALTISGASTSGQFAQTNTCGTSVAAGASCSFSVTFVPTTTDSATGALTITDNAAGSPRTVTLSGNGVIPVASLALTSLTFTGTTAGVTTAAQTVVLTNTGNATLNFTIPPNITGVNSSEFAIFSNTCPASLAAGANCAISITFTPSAAGTQLAALSIADNAPGSPQTVSLIGLAPAVTVAPTSLTFADRPVGTTSAAQTVTLTNSGSAELLISSIGTTGDFTKSDACGASLAAGANCVISVTFKPTAVGNRYGTLVITDNAANSPQTVLLAGNGQAVPTVSLTPASLTFGDQALTTTSGPQTVTLTNIGGAPLAISSVTITGANGGDFAITSSTCTGTFAAGAGCVMTVVFAPTAEGLRVASIRIDDDAPDTPQTVPLTGNGILLPGVAFSPTSLTFADQSVGTSSQPQTVTLTNSGGGSLTITSIGVTGTNASDFSANHNCGATLGPGLHCTITVIFTPSATGNRLATLTVSDNAPGSPQSVPLFGGSAPGTGDFLLSVNPTTGAVFAGDTARFTLAVTPLNGFNSKVNLTCTGAPRGGACTVSPTFVTPDGTNPSTATVSVTTAIRTLAPPTSGPTIHFPGDGVRWLPWIFALLLMATVVLSGRRRALLVLGVLMLFVLLWSACAGGGEVGVPRGTPAGTYNLTITAVSGSTTKTTAVSLTVN